jgi:hypothetical protein
MDVKQISRISEEEEVPDIEENNDPDVEEKEVSDVEEKEVSDVEKKEVPDVVVSVPLNVRIESICFGCFLCQLIEASSSAH